MKNIEEALGDSSMSLNKINCIVGTWMINYVRKIALIAHDHRLLQVKIIVNTERSAMVSQQNS